MHKVHGQTDGRRSQIPSSWAPVGAKKTIGASSSVGGCTLYIASNRNVQGKDITIKSLQYMYTQNMYKDGIQ